MSVIARKNVRKMLKGVTLPGKHAALRPFNVCSWNLLQFDKARLAMAKRLMIEGRVQGVGYRASFADQALALGLSGWVRNRRDGSVEACVHGEAAALEAIILWARRGPPAALVRNVTIEDVEEPEPLDGAFKIC